MSRSDHCDERFTVARWSGSGRALVICRLSARSWMGDPLADPAVLRTGTGSPLVLQLGEPVACAALENRGFGQVSAGPTGSA
jgi:hypothetical protein